MTDDVPYAQAPRLAAAASSSAGDSGAVVEVVDGWVDVAGAVLVDRTIVLPDAEVVELTDCVLRSCRVITASDAVVRAVRTTFESCELSQAHFKSAQMSRFSSCKMAGTSMVGNVADCEFVDCQLQLASLVLSKISRTSFARCELIDVDLQESRLSDVSFVGSRLREVSLHRTTFERVDLRGAAIESLSNVTSLDGCLITQPQLFEVAPLLAGIVGLTVEEP